MSALAPAARAFDTLLVANRGEIAARVLRAARALGLRTVAVHARGERDAVHASLADEAIELRGDSPLQAYLSIEGLLEACARSGAGAVHPGYGFLAENAAFARACEAADVVFVGPPAAAIERLGNKTQAKALAQRLGIPCLPGYGEAAQAQPDLAQAAAALGTPLMIKAAAGGGGRGMRRVDSLESFAASCAAAANEAQAAFGDATLMLEKLVEGARHVEMQLLADRFGHCVHLGERDCSTQRRHQKIIEEAPSPGMPAATREAMGAAAVELLRAAGYVGAGTVEFLLDRDGRFHFLEVNTRLQVEHRVTEALTGVDLVEWQLRIARGERLTLVQNEIRLDGHAIEARLCAEDAWRGFAPRSGRVVAWRIAEDEHVLVDHALGPHAAVSPHFDSLIAKFVAHGRDREQARSRLVAALERSSVLGPTTNRAFLLACLRAPRFVAAELYTDWVAQAAHGWPAPEPDDEWRAVASALWVHAQARAYGPLAGWSSSGVREMLASLARVDDDGFAPVASGDASPHWEARIDAQPEGLRVRIDGREHVVRIDAADSVRIDGRRCAMHTAVRPAAPGTVFRAWLDLHGVAGCVTDAAALPARTRRADAASDVRAGMHGRIASLAVAEGDRVLAGQAILSIEAMKMEQRIAAPVRGRIAALPARVGAQVSPATLLARIEPECAP